MSDQGLVHIQRAGRRYGRLFAVLMAVIPILDVAYWASFNHLPGGFLTDLPVAPTQPLSATALTLAFLASLVPMGVALYGLQTLRLLFALYENAIIFSTNNVRYFRQLGYTFVAWVVANTAFGTLISIIITFANPPGERTVVAEFGIIDVSTLILGGVVLLIAWVMNEGHRLEDEQAHTI